MNRISIVFLTLFVKSLVFGATIDVQRYPTPVIPEWNDEESTAHGIGSYLMKVFSVLHDLAITNVVDLLNQKGARDTALLKWLENQTGFMINTLESLLVDFNLLSNYKPKNKAESLCYDQYKMAGLHSLQRKVKAYMGNLNDSNNYELELIETYLKNQLKLAKKINFQYYVEQISQSNQRDNTTVTVFQENIRYVMGITFSISEDLQILLNYERGAVNISSCYNWYIDNAFNSLKKKNANLHECLKNGVKSLYDPLASSSPTSEVIYSGGVNSITETNNTFIPVNFSASPLWIILPIVGLMGVILVFYLWWKCCKCSLFGFKKNKSDKNEEELISLDTAVIQDQQFMSNPQYLPHSCIIPTHNISIDSVSLLNRNSITDLKKIGEGFFGEVYKGLLHSINNEVKHTETVAIKMLKQTVNETAQIDFLREIKIISTFQHPNILTLVGICPQENMAHPWMIFEYMPFGDLADVLQNGNPKFWVDDQDLPTLTVETLLSICLQIACGMQYLTTQRFIHRDLACRNCLVGSAMIVKISDFGMSRDVYCCDYYQVNENMRMLPVRWMSPEALSFGKFTLESDVWSYGVVLWEIYSSGMTPYYGYTNEQVVKLITDHIQLEIPENCPNEVADIMRLCWQINVTNRIQFLDICYRISNLKENTVKNRSPSSTQTSHGAYNNQPPSTIQ